MTARGANWAPTPRNGPLTARSSSGSSRRRRRTGTRSSSSRTISKRVLFVYGYEPSGHAAAASALEAAAVFLDCSTRRVNIAADYHPILGPALAKTYLTIIQKAPGLWAALYDNEALAGVAKDWRKLYLMFEGSKMRSTLTELNPDLIVCTHAPPLAALGLEKGSGRLTCPLVAAITDYSVHSYWLDSSADLYLAPTPEAAESLVKRGISRDRVRETGIPIHPTFETPLERAEARLRRGFPLERLLVLVSGGSRGIGPILDVAGYLLGRFAEARIAIACGDNEALLASAGQRFGGESRVFSYGRLQADAMKELMCAADVLIGKSGGLTVAESLALGLPMVVFEPIPGQEEHNSEYLLGRKAGLRALTLPDLGAAVASAAEFKDRAKALGRPGSARLGMEAALKL